MSELVRSLLLGSGLGYLWWSACVALYEWEAGAHPALIVGILRAEEVEQVVLFHIDPVLVYGRSQYTGLSSNITVAGPTVKIIKN